MSVNHIADRGWARLTGVARKSLQMRAPILALAIAAMSASWSLTPSPAVAAEPEKYGDWFMRCEKNADEESGEICYIHQTINYNKDNVSGMLLDVKIVGALGEGKEPYTIIMLPLGLNFQSGVVVQADAGEPTMLTIQTCTKEGCRSFAQISDDLLWGFRKGSLLKVGFVAFGGTQTVVVEASLNGFTAAFEAMISR